MRDSERNTFGQVLSAVLDIYGARVTQASLGVWWAALERFDFDAVRGALSSHVSDPIAGKFSPKPADIIGHLQTLDDRPGAEEAWAMMPRDEATTVVWTEEMAQAWGIALPLLNASDQVAARMAFIECYRRLVQQARSKGLPAQWFASLGHDAQGRELVLLEAVKLGRLSAPYVRVLLPNIEPPTVNVLALIQRRAAALKAPANESAD